MIAAAEMRSIKAWITFFMAVPFVWDYIMHAVLRFGIYYFLDIMDMQFMIRMKDDCGCIECGNSQGIRIPSDLVEATGISEGTRLKWQRDLIEA